MRWSVVLLGVCSPLAYAPPGDADAATARKRQTLEFIASLEVPQGGFAAAPLSPAVDALPQPSLRATSAAVRAWKYLGGEKLGRAFPNRDRHAAFVLKCYDPRTGGFAEEPGGRPDVTLTSVGVMAALELGVPKEKFAPALEYLKANARTFEELRIAAAAVEAWGPKDSPFDPKDLLERFGRLAPQVSSDAARMRNGGARDWGSVVATTLRLGNPLDEAARRHAADLLRLGQRDDGGWGRAETRASDLETTYRVLRAFVLLGQKPDVPAVRRFVQAHRNPDGGYTLTPGDKSSLAGTYYAVVIEHWLEMMERPK